MTTAVDLFAGWGGFTEGAEQAGVDVVWAANHWPLAVEAHAANHPSTRHECQDLRQADWSALPKFDILLAAPACQGHSSAARGPRKAASHVRRTHDSLRATAWAVVDCAEVCEPEALVVENVVDFRRWGPPGEPGAFFQHWLDALRLRGYELQVEVVRASNYDTPQRRDRLFVIGTRSASRIELPEHRPEPAFEPCIEWDTPNAPWSRIDKRPRVHERILRSRKLWGDVFLTQHTRDHMGVPLSEPIRTITTKDQWALVDGKFYRPLTLRENARAMGFRDDYFWPEHATRKEALRGLGNAVCPPVGRMIVGAVAAALEERKAA